MNTHQTCKVCGVKLQEFGQYQGGRLVAVQYVHPDIPCKRRKRSMRRWFMRLGRAFLAAIVIGNIINGNLQPFLGVVIYVVLWVIYFVVDVAFAYQEDKKAGLV